MANSKSYGLAPSTVWVTTYNPFDVALPYRGYKASVIEPELGIEALESDTQTQSVYVDLH